MPPRINHKSHNGYSRWAVIGAISLITAALVVLLIGGWFLYTTKLNPGKLHRLAAIPITASAMPTPPRYECPLDGTVLTLSNSWSSARRPIVVQIDNAPGARPQSGLSQADLVYEYMAEGQITRFSAVFLCHDAAEIGPVRSARLVDLELAPEYSALLADSGSSEGVTAQLEAHPDIPNIVPGTFAGAYYRTYDRVEPHNLMSSTDRIRAAARAANIPTDIKVPSLLFKDDTPAPAIQTLGIRYSPWADIEYRYDAASNAWLRFLDGQPHMDAMTGGQLAAWNVIIQYVDITESEIEEDTGGNKGLELRLTGQGRAQLFQDGRMIECFWRRDGRNSLTYYVDASGQLLPLNRGLTFVQLVPQDFRPKIN